MFKHLQIKEETFQSFQTKTYKQNIRKAKSIETKSKNRTNEIELPRLKSSFNFSLWAIKGTEIFCCFWLMVYPQPINRVDG